MKIKIIAFGKLDEKYFVQASDEYQKRLTKYCDLEIIELKEEFNKDNSIDINSSLLINKINGFKDYEVIVLDVNSKIVSSVDLADIISENKNFKSGKVLFVIGPSDGFSKEFKTNNYKFISFGNITLPHQLFRIILEEQIYRSFKIINNEKYHK